MLTMQEQINQRIHAHWRTHHHDWYRAIWIECAELLEHHGWKWWKKQTQDLAQVQLELIDIWHFGLSALLQHQPDHAIIASALLKDFQHANTASTQNLNFAGRIEQLVLETLQTKQFNAQLFFGLLPMAQLSMDDLYHTYLSKNVLNLFRQDHGYQQGSYLKHWNGLEDNEHLRLVMSGVDLQHPQVYQHLYQGLKNIYPTSA
jgi:dimeric dUTPase (all-alpha-NTP-PPase superfamily)